MLPRFPADIFETKHQEVYMHALTLQIQLVGSTSQRVLDLNSFPNLWICSFWIPSFFHHFSGKGYQAFHIVTHHSYLIAK